ncbi:MAG: gamma-glutamyl-gamma-aminobutyrate hydrolase family protein [Candidatus Latescibacteria bacterium]|nr:gamma-glutamyl-gamma-aminobutyrate hydrolase family protein [Candidatus Latescibacterota bacterium]
MKPHIGITLDTPKPGKTREDVIETSARYLQSVEEADGAAKPLIAPDPADDRAAAALVIRLDGLILSGGGDVHPRHYARPRDAGYEEALRGWLYPDEPRDEAEFRLLRHYLPTGKPILAICRGFQVLNVALGGKLIADVSAREHNTRRDGTSGYHAVELVPETRLSQVLGGGAHLYVNSRHHQGLVQEMLAPGLRPTATSEVGDLLVEGFEVTDDRWLIGVQWHPERIADFGEREQEASRALFRAFVDAARRET